MSDLFLQFLTLDFYRMDYKYFIFNSNLIGKLNTKWLVHNKEDQLSMSWNEYKYSNLKSIEKGWKKKQ